MIAVLLRMAVLIVRFGEGAFAALFTGLATGAAVAILAALLAAVRMLTQTVRFQRVVRALGRALVQLLLRILLGALVRLLTVPGRNGGLLRRRQCVEAAAVPATTEKVSIRVAVRWPDDSHLDVLHFLGLK